MFDIICVGSANIDVFVNTENKLFLQKSKQCIKVPFGSKILIKDLKFAFGGGGHNTATAFARLGLKTGFVGALGNDANADLILKELKKEKINPSNVVKKKKESPYSVILDAQGHDRTILVHKGAANDLKYSDLNLKKLKTKWFYFSTLLNTGFKTLVKLSVFAKKNNIKIAFNPSTYLAAKGKRYLGKLLKRCEVLVLNKEEAQLLTQKKTANSDILLKHLFKLGPNYVVITDGPNPANAYDGYYKYTIAPRRLKVLEATGAGDAFASGFVYGIMKDLGTETALKIGLAQSESVITHFGAKEKLLTKAELAKAIRKAKYLVRKIRI